jgi:ubiquinone biosynthesis monooxygenase Coq7
MTKAKAKKSKAAAQMETIAPGDRARIARILRVNQAGEYGARRIYAGQIAVLKRRKVSAKALAAWQHMQEQEEAHLAAFNAMIAEHQVRPTALQPLWHAAGFGLGAVTALLGEKAAHACTVAVEEVIDEHYAAQEKQLDEYPKLKKTIAAFRAEENEHKQMALEAGAESAPGYKGLRRLIRAGSKTAIWLAERI